MQLHLVALVLQVRQTAQDGALVHRLAAAQVQDHAHVGVRVPQAIDGGDAGDDDNVRPLQDGLGGGEAHLLDVLVDGRVLLDVSVRGGDVGLRLVIVIVGDEVLHGVAREEVAHLAVELGGQGFVGRQDQGRTLQFLDDVGDGEGLARAGHPQQGQARLAIPQPLHQATDGRRLIAGGAEGGDQFEGLVGGAVHGGSQEDRRVRGGLVGSGWRLAQRADEACGSGLATGEADLAPRPSLTATRPGRDQGTLTPVKEPAPLRGTRQ